MAIHQRSRTLNADDKACFAEAKIPRAKFSTGAPTKLGTITPGTRQENLRDSAPFTWPYSANTPFCHEFRGLYYA